MWLSLRNSMIYLLYQCYIKVETVKKSSWYLHTDGKGGLL